MELRLWLGDRPVAYTVTQPRSGRLRIHYDEEAAASVPDGTALLSCSLLTPGPSQPALARAFLEGLLPEGQPLEAAAASVRGVRLLGGAPETPADAVLLLAEYGRECAGAVFATPSDEFTVPRGSYEAVDRTRMSEIVRQLPSQPLGSDPDREIRLSLAGAQPKFLLARFGDAWFEPLGGAASTHILKPTANWPDSARNEALVLALARAVGLSTSDSWVETVDGTDILVTARYDRRIQGRSVQRLHQEDMCQALGLRPIEKYQIGRPSQRMAMILRRFTADPARETIELFRQVAFRVLIGDEDGHGKNFSLLLDDGSVRLAPLYDSLCTLVYPQLSGTMATPIGNQQRLATVTREALLDEARAMALAGHEALSTLEELSDAMDSACDRLPEALLSGWSSGQVMKTIRTRLKRLRSGVALGDVPGRAPTHRGTATMGQ